MIPLALIHVGEPLAPHDLLGAWSLEPAVLIALGAAALLYSRGVRALWLGKPGRGIRRWEAWCFLGGWTTLALALLSPLHRLGEALFSAHMVQHTLLMMVAAPLLVLGRPVVPFLWALPIGRRRRAGGVGKSRAVRTAWRAATTPFAAWALHAAALWIWHLPAPYQASLASELAHTAQHASFLGTGLLFWWALVHGREGRMGYGGSVFYLFATAMHSGGLGALLTVAPTPWYPRYAPPEAWGLTALEDQQLAGLIMWVPASGAYLLAGLALLVAWMRESERKTARWEASALIAPALALLLLSGCGMRSEDQSMEEAALLTGGDPWSGKEKIASYGCGACHTIPGVSGADREVGPPLAGIARRVYIAGVLPNSVENMVAWIQDPPRVDSLTAMPNLGVHETDARDIAAYLYSLD